MHDLLNEMILFEESTRQTETPEFRAWFGDSKVVDSNGDPLVVYHGTPTPTFEEFEIEAESNEGEGNWQQGPGFYFTDDSDNASNYAQMHQKKTGAVYPVYLKIEKPLPIDFERGWRTGTDRDLTRSQVTKIIKMAPDIKDPDGPLSNWGDVKYEGYNKVFQEAVDAYSDQNSFMTLHNDFYDGHTQEYLKAINKVLGYDGVVSKVKATGATHWVAWFPSQVKSAIGNKGTFNSESDNIVESN